MKKSHLNITFVFPLPSPFSFPLQIFLKIAPATHFFVNLIFHLQKSRGIGSG